MSDVDTSGPAVERLAELLDSIRLAGTQECCWEAAATLRALAGERDALRVEAKNAEEAFGGMAATLHATMAALTAARAEAARLREALDYYADTFCELGAAEEACGKLDTEHCSGCLARAALAGEPQP